MFPKNPEIIVQSQVESFRQTLSNYISTDDLSTSPLPWTIID